MKINTVDFEFVGKEQGRNVRGGVDKGKCSMIISFKNNPSYIQFQIPF